MHADAQLAAVRRRAVNEHVVAEATDLILEHVQRHDAAALVLDVPERQRRAIALLVELIHRLVLLRRSVAAVKDAVERRATHRRRGIGAARARLQQARLHAAFRIAGEDALLTCRQLSAALGELRHDRVMLAAGGGVVGVRVEGERAAERLRRSLLHVLDIDRPSERAAVGGGALGHELFAARGGELGERAVVRPLVHAEQLGRAHARVVRAHVHVAALIERPLVKLLADQHDAASLADEHRRRWRECGCDFEECGDDFVVGAAGVACGQLRRVHVLRCGERDVEVTQLSGALTAQPEANRSLLQPFGRAGDDAQLEAKGRVGRRRRHHPVLDGQPELRRMLAAQHCAHLPEAHHPGPVLLHVSNEQPLLGAGHVPLADGVEHLGRAALAEEHAAARQPVAHVFSDVEQRASKVEEVGELAAPHGLPGGVREGEEEQEDEHLHEHVLKCEARLAAGRARLGQQHIEPAWHPVQPRRRRAQQEIGSARRLAIGWRWLEGRGALGQLGWRAVRMGTHVLEAPEQLLGARLAPVDVAKVLLPTKEHVGSPEHDLAMLAARPMDWAERRHWREQQLLIARGEPHELALPIEGEQPVRVLGEQLHGVWGERALALLRELLPRVDGLIELRGVLDLTQHVRAAQVEVRERQRRSTAWRALRGLLDAHENREGQRHAEALEERIERRLIFDWRAALQHAQRGSCCQRGSDEASAARACEASAYRHAEHDREVVLEPESLTQVGHQVSKIAHVNDALSRC